MTPWRLDSGLAFNLLVGSTLVIALALMLLVVGTFLLQGRADRRNARRIAAFQAWEAALPPYLFGGAPLPEVFRQVDPRDRDFLLAFLGRSRATLAGVEGERLREIYLAAGLRSDLEARLRSRSPRTRALAALEVASFAAAPPDGSGEEPYAALVPLLDDPIPFVAFAAVRTLARSGDLTFAAPVLAWVMDQELYQQVRVTAVLESFGPQLLPWLEARFCDKPYTAAEWRLFAQLAGSHRHQESLPRLLELLEAEDREVQAAAIHALQAIGDPIAFPVVSRFVRADEGLLRMQAAQALGPLGGPKAIPALVRLLADPVFEVRRHASLGLSGLGVPGVAALRQIVEDPQADRYARGMAQERLEWAEQRGRL